MRRRRAAEQDRLFQPGNILYCGDNLEVLDLYVRDESVDLVYLDPPFKEHPEYNLLFEELSGRKASAQQKAFAKTWTWGPSAIEAYNEVVESGGRLSDTMRAFGTFLWEDDILAYLAMMAPRLVQIHRVLKPTGSLYLHCDPSHGHYLKILLDAVFGPDNFRSEIVWKRTGAHSSANRWGPVHDLVLFYTKTDTFTWNPQFVPHDPQSDYVRTHYTQTDPDGRRWMPDNLTAMGTRNGSSGQPWRGFDVAAKGNHWKFTAEGLERLDAEGRIYWPSRGGWPRYKRYLDQVKGRAVQDVWTDIAPVNAKAAERLGYPTQKPKPLLQRVIAASSNPGDRVLDPFCGCGTTVEAAQEMGRYWTGIDITNRAIGEIEGRIQKMPGPVVYEVEWEPFSEEDAAVLAEKKPLAFQRWAVRRLGGTGQEKQGADRGIDGRIFFREEPGSPPQQVVISVKAGRVQPAQVRELRGTVNQEKAAIGVLVTMREPTTQMRRAAIAADPYISVYWGSKHPGIQLITARQILDGRTVDYPRTDRLPAALRIEVEAALAEQKQQATLAGRS